MIDAPLTFFNDNRDNRDNSKPSSQASDNVERGDACMR